jgi:hypothetical protein
MALNNYSTDLLVVTVNGRVITDFGESDPPVSHDPIDARSTLRRGMGGNATRLDRINPGRTFTLNLNPGSPDSAYMQGLDNSRANITISVTQVGTLETALGSEGIIVNDGSVGRGGQTITDDQYIIECNAFTQTKGAA